MKTYNRIIILALTVLLVNACKQNYIDDISRVDPGADATAPAITVNFPPEGYELQTNATIASINIDFEVTDDIEIASISLKIDGTEIASYNEFKDYRKVMKEFLYDNVTTGAHVLTVTASDLEGKTTTLDVNFSKSPPYVPVYDGEIFYMPFNNEFREMNSLELATTVGMPGFIDGIQGGTAYAGAADSYLTFPTAGFTGSSFSAAFWYKVNVSPDRSGILNASIPGEDRTKGFRLFREGNASTQRIKLNVGTGSGETWNDGQEFDATTGDWVHVAFTISTDKCAIYIDGDLAAEVATTGIDWTGCDAFSIGSGAPNFSYWGHGADLSLYDELRMFNKALTQDEIRTIMLKEQATFKMGFNGNYKDAITGNEATVVGYPGFEYGAGVFGDAYVGATDAYLTFPTTDLQGDEFSASFWMNINATPDRAGILVMGPEDVANPDAQNIRTSGFRFFRENAAGMQRFKLNAGDGAADTWFDGGAAADVDPSTGNWVHFAFAIGATEARVYIDGIEVKQGVFSGIDWTGCDILSIMSGAPRFTGWGHLSDESMMDELYLFNKALSAEDVTLLMNDGL